MKTIYKYTFSTFPNVELDIPEGADILKVAWQDGQPNLWAVVDTERNPEHRRFVLVATGAEIRNQKDLRYIDSIFFSGMVYHVFEVVPVEDL